MSDPMYSFIVIFASITFLSLYVYAIVDAYHKHGLLVALVVFMLPPVGIAHGWWLATR